MKRKLLSFAIAFAMLSQTMVSAGALYTLLSTAGLAPVTHSVVTTVESRVKGSGDAAYSETGGDTAYQNFDYKVTLKMDKVRDKFDELYLKGSALTGAELTAFNASTIEGKFEITFAVPDLTNSYLTWSGAGSDAAASLKTALDAQLSTINSGIYSVNKVTITLPTTVVVEIITSGKTIAQFKANSSYLDDITLSLTGLTAGEKKAEITVQLTKGETDIYDGASSPYSVITYTSNKSSNLAWNYVVASNSGGGGSSSTPKDDGKDDGDEVDSTIGVTANGDVVEGSPEVEVGPAGSLIIARDSSYAGGTQNGYIVGLPPVKKGMVSVGWNKENGEALEATGTTEEGEPIFSLGTLPADGTPIIVRPNYRNITVPEALADDESEHKAYIAGYPDGEVKPNNNITREEVTAAFYRLLDAEYKATIETSEQNFPDVNSDRWSNDAIATMAAGNFIVGDDTGKFNPAKPITRAEFAVIAAKFAAVDAESLDNYFTDIDEHWAKDYILKVAGQYWISGYEDGSFKPDAPITRAEAMTIINRMLARYGDTSAEFAKQWPDVSTSDWYYDKVIEATTEHKFERNEDGTENWLAE